MIMAGMVGYGIDWLLGLVSRNLTRWKHAR